MPTWIRVRDRATGHEYDVADSAFNPDAHERLSKSQFPNVSGLYARSRPAKHRTDKSGKSPARTGGQRDAGEKE